jgi:hypothetical protein
MPGRYPGASTRRNTDVPMMPPMAPPPMSVADANARFH